MRQGMTVSDLIDELSNYDEDMEVMFAYDYGDHVHTTVAEGVTGVFEETVEYSEYHRSYRVIDEDEEDDLRMASGKRVVVIAG